MTREFVEFPFLLFIRLSISSVGHLPGGGPTPCITDSFITRVVNFTIPILNESSRATKHLSRDFPIHIPEVNNSDGFFEYTASRRRLDV